MLKKCPAELCWNQCRYHFFFFFFLHSNFHVLLESGLSLVNSQLVINWFLALPLHCWYLFWPVDTSHKWYLPRLSTDKVKEGNNPVWLSRNQNPYSMVISRVTQQILDYVRWRWHKPLFKLKALTAEKLMCNNCLGAERKHEIHKNTLTELIIEGLLSYLQVLEECATCLQSGA